MNIVKLSTALTAVGLLFAAPAFAQSSGKQPAQSESPSMPGPSGGNFNADPGYKQPAQSETPSMAAPTGGNFNADPSYKQHTQSLTPLSNEDSGKQK